MDKTNKNFEFLYIVASARTKTLIIKNFLKRCQFWLWTTYTFLGSKWAKIECTECLLMQDCVIKLGCIVNDIAFFWDHYFTWLHICRVVWPHFKRLLLHILTGLPLGPKPTTSSLKVFKSCGKSCEKLQNSDFQSQFSMSKIIRIFLKNFFHWRISF